MARMSPHSSFAFVSCLAAFVVVSFVSAHAPPAAVAGAVCETPRPFVPPAAADHHGNATFHSAISRSLGRPNHRGQDVVVGVGAPQVLVAKFAYGVVDKDLEEERVTIWAQKDAPCGPWVRLGETTTTDDGRVSFTIPPALARPVGRHPIRLLVAGDRSQAALTLHVLRAGTAAVVFDIDGTLTTGDAQFWKEIVGQLTGGEHVPDLRPGSVEVAAAWARAGYLVVYMTGRPLLLRRETEAWLRESGFPPGVLRMAESLEQTLPTSWGVAHDKASSLTRWAKEAQITVFAAYGNAPTDIEAYREAGVPLERTWILGEHAGEAGTQPVRDYREHLRRLGALPAATVAAPPLVAWPPAPGSHDGAAP